MSCSPAVVLVIEPYPVLRAALCERIAAISGLAVIGQEEPCAENLQAALARQPQIVLLSLPFPEAQSLTTIAELHQRLPQARLLILVEDEASALAKAALARGAHAVLSKACSLDELAHTISAQARSP